MKNSSKNKKLKKNKEIEKIKIPDKLESKKNEKIFEKGVKLSKI